MKSLLFFIEIIIGIIIEIIIETVIEAMVERIIQIISEMLMESIIRIMIEIIIEIVTEPAILQPRRSMLYKKLRLEGNVAYNNIIHQGSDVFFSFSVNFKVFVIG